MLPLKQAFKGSSNGHYGGLILEGLSCQYTDQALHEILSGKSHISEMI